MHKKEHQAAKISAGILKGLVFASAALTFLVLFFLIVYILVHGIPNLTPQLFAWKYTSENASMLPSIINIITGHCSAAWYFFRNLPCGICKKRK